MQIKRYLIFQMISMRINYNILKLLNNQMIYNNNLKILIKIINKKKYIIIQVNNRTIKIYTNYQTFKKMNNFQFSNKKLITINVKDW